MPLKIILALVFIIRFVVSIYSGYYFLTGDKRDMKTLWYGLLCVLALA